MSAAVHKKEITAQIREPESLILCCHTNMNQNEIVPEQHLAPGQLKWAPSLVQSTRSLWWSSSKCLTAAPCGLQESCWELWREFSLRAMVMEGSRISGTMVPPSQPREIISSRGQHVPLSHEKLPKSTPRGHYSAAYPKKLYSLSQ